MKKIISYSSSFLLFIFLLLFVIVSVLNYSIFSKDYMQKKLDACNYYDNVYENVIESFENNLIQSGVDISVSSDIVSKEEVKEDILGIINAFYLNENIVVDTSKITLRLDDIIKDVIHNNNREISSEELKDINTLLKNIEEVYVNEISYSINTLNSYNSIFYKVSSYIDIANIVLLIICLVGIGILAFKKKYNYLCIAGIACNLALIIFCIFVHGSYENILILNNVFSDTFIYVINNVLNILQGVGIIFLGVFILISIKYGEVS